MIALRTAELDRPTLRRTALFAVNIGFAVIAAAVLAEWRMALVGAMIAMVLSFADDDGALSGRLAMLALVIAGMAAGGIAGLLLGISSKLFWPLFLAAAFAAGWLYRAQRGPQLAARVFAIAFSIIAGLPTVTGSETRIDGRRGRGLRRCRARSIISCSGRCRGTPARRPPGRRPPRSGCGSRSSTRPPPDWACGSA